MKDLLCMLRDLNSFDLYENLVSCQCSLELGGRGLFGKIWAIVYVGRALNSNGLYENLVSCQLFKCQK